MTSSSPNRRRRQTTVALSVVLGLLLVSCDRRPTVPPSELPPPPPLPQRSTGPIAFVSNRDGTHQIYLASEDGSLVTPLVTGWQPAWARDGRRIAFSVGGDIHVIGVDGSGDRVIAGGGTDPAWSPDGRSIVFVSRTGDCEIAMVNIDGSNWRCLFDSGGFISGSPAWSPDGQRIVFAIGTWADWCFGLWIVTADGSSARQLGGPGVRTPSGLLGSCFFGGASLWDGGSPSWSLDGSEIAFVSDPGGQPFSIHVVRADGSGRRLRVPAPAFDPDWTPDGRLIYAKGERPFGPSRIFINDGGTERQLIPDAIAPARPSYGDSQPVWLR